MGTNSTYCCCNKKSQSNIGQIEGNRFDMNIQTDYDFLNSTIINTKITIQLDKKIELSSISELNIITISESTQGLA